jgi:acyl-CoA thioester hydrolase
MSKAPAIYSSTHRIKFSDLDPYKHMRTAIYSAYYVDHRMSALREQAGWDLKTLESLPFMTFVRRLDVEFIRSVFGDQEISIASFGREF